MKKITIQQNRLLIPTLVFLVLLGVASSCKKSTDNPNPNEVYIKNMAFTPSTINVNVNTTVTWYNKDGIAHTVTSNSSLFDSGSIPNNGKFSQTFTTAGSYTYHCSIHPSMVGTVIVNAGGTGTAY